MSAIEKLIGSDKIPEWVQEMPNPEPVELLGDPETRHRKILRYMDFGELDILARHRTTYLHTDYDGFRKPVVRMEFRIGVKETEGEVYDKYDIEPLINSDYYVTHVYKDDITYVNFFFELPQTLKQFVSEFDQKLDD